MTKLKELKKVIANGMIGEFDDGLLGVFIQGTFILSNGGRPLKHHNKKCVCFGKKLLKVYRLKEYPYQADMNYWLEQKHFLDYVEEVVWENKDEKKR